MFKIPSLFQSLFRTQLRGKKPWKRFTKITNRYKSEQAPPQNDRLCIFAHFDKWKRIDPHVLHYLKRLRGAGCDILMVSACTSLLREDREKALKYCSEIITRTNTGYDFGSYAIGLDLMKLEISIRYRQIILCNDSVYGPFHDLKHIFDEMDSRGLDAWGMTDSFQLKYHLQSYFLVFKSSVLQKPRMRNFWDNLSFKLPKKEVIKHCEIGFTQILRRSHLAVGCWCPYEKVQQSVIKVWQSELRKGEYQNNSLSQCFSNREKRHFIKHVLQQNCNPTHQFWNVLLTHHHYPFLKVELVKHNPTKQFNLSLIPEILPQISNYPVNFVYQHTKRTS